MFILNTAQDYKFSYLKREREFSQDIHNLCLKLMHKMTFKFNVYMVIKIFTLWDEIGQLSQPAEIELVRA